MDGKHDDGQEERAAEELVREQRQLALQGGSLGEAQEAAQEVDDAAKPANKRLLEAVLDVHGTAGLAALVSRRGGDLPHGRLHPRGDHDAATAAFTDYRGGKGQINAVPVSYVICRVGEISRLGVDDVVFDNLLHRQRLAGHGLLVAVEIHNLEQTEIGRDGIPILQMNDVTRDYLGAAD